MGEPNGHPKSDGDEPPPTGAMVILDYFRTRYRPLFRRGNAVVSADGETITQGPACTAPCSDLIQRLKGAADAPAVYGEGGLIVRIRTEALPAFFRTWASVAWGDLIKSLPDEDAAELGRDGPAREEFRRLVTQALLTEVVLGQVIGKGMDVTQTERRSLIGWCEQFAKPGPWRSIRSKQCWCKLVMLGDGLLMLRVAIRHGLFGQLKADRRLTEMPANSFGRRAERYGVGATPRDDRPHGQRCVVLDDEFVRELLEGVPDDGDTEAENGCPEG